MNNRIRVYLLVATACTLRTAAAQEVPSGDAVIRRAAGDSEIVITTTDRLAGAIGSLTWNGREFIDAADHGRELQSASNFDAGGRIRAETFNPTEAGSRHDGAGDESSSRLLHLIAEDDVLQTTTQMAFWLTPNEASLGNPAKNTTVVSNHLLTKRVQIGEPFPQAISYDVTFHVPVGEHHTQAVFEVVTGYMPVEFETFWAFDPETRELQPLSDGPGEQPYPVVLATADGEYAMGCVAVEALTPGAVGPGYGRFRFERERVVKWNCVYRYFADEGIEPGEYAFRTIVLVGDLETVEGMLQELIP